MLNKSLLKDLIYEKINGKVIYYKNYELVLKGKKDLEEVMASSGLQVFIIKIIYNFLQNLISNEFEILFGEIGVRTINGWRSLDIGIFETNKVKNYLTINKIIDIPPKVAIEVDTKAESNLIDYVFEKTLDLLKTGTEKIIWIFTKPKLILIAKKESWVIKNWNEDIDVIENISFNLEKLLGGKI
ncbi:MAG: Uma2 family endonuclease [candidate division WOR-3 bacterium]